MTSSSLLSKVFITVVLVAVVPGSISLGDKCTSNCTNFIARSPPGVCPTWLVPNYTIKDRCDCGIDFIRSVKCYSSSNSSLLRNGYCMTYNETSKLTFIGDCPYNTNQAIGPQFYPLPKDVLQLNDHMCGPLNRTGLLCSQCQEGLGPAALSAYRECLECMDEPYGWIFYIFMAMFPQTVFCFFVIIFRINAASPPLNAFVLTAQVVTNLINVAPANSVNGFLAKFLATLYGFWNLDFFTYVIPPFCIKEGMSTLTI